MRTITLPAHNRPHYLSQTIESLSKLDLTGYKLFVNLEPGCKENVDLINAIDFIDVDLQTYPVKLGVTFNPFNLIDRAFHAGSEWNYHIEDDIIFSPDTMNLVNWYFNNQQDGVIVYGTCFRENQIEDTSDNKIFTNGTGFSGLGWCTTPEHWNNHIRNLWFLPSPLGPGQQDGWDWNFSRYLRDNKLKEMVPLMPRTTTIGEFGTYSSPASHKLFKNLNIAKNIATDFIIDTSKNR